MNDKIKILIAEHDAVDLDLLERELKMGGINYESEVVQNEQDFSNALTNFTPDIILSDYTFPSFNGPAAFNIREKLAPHTPFIFVSGTIGEEKSIELIKNGVTDYVLKDRLLSLPIKIKRALKESNEKQLKNKAEKDLQNAYDRISFHLDNSPLAFIEWDNNIKPTSWSKRAEEIFGWTEKEVKWEQLNWFSKVYEEDLPEVMSIVEKMLAGKIEKIELQHRNYTRDGRVIWCNWFNSVLKDNDGNVKGILSLIQNITEKKEAEIKLIKSEQKYRTLFEQNLAGVYLSTINGVILNCNEAFAKMLKYDSSQELLEINAFELYFSEKDRHNFIDNVIGQKKLYNYEVVLKCKDGSLVYVIENISLRKDEVTGEEICDGILIDITERKLAELRLKESHAKYKAIIDNPMNAFLLSDTEGNILEVNNTTCKTLGYTKEELLVLNRKDVLEVNYPGYVEAIKTRKKTGVAVGEVYGIRKTGERFPVSFTTSAFYTAEGEERLSSIGVDITDKKKAEEKLLKSNERFINVSKATFDAIWDWDIKTKELYLGDGFQELFGYHIKNNVGTFSDWADHIHPQDKERIIESRLNKIINSDQSNWTDDYRYMRADDSVAYVLDRGILLRDDKGAYRMIGAMQDVTKLKQEDEERRRAELAVTQVLKEKNIILESIGDAFFAVDKNWAVTYWNSQAEKMLKVSKDEIVGNYLWDIFSDSIESESYKKYHQAVDTNEVVHFEDYYSALNNWYEISAYPSGDGLAVYFKDITERKHSEIRVNKLNENLLKQAKKLEASNAELERYAYVTSHDLQEPLRMVTSFLQLLQQKYDQQLDVTAQKYINFAVDGAARMKILILDLLEFSRISSVMEDHHVIDLNDTIANTRLALKAAIDESQALINVHSLPKVYGNESQLLQLFQNIISNAIKYKSNVKPVIEIGAIEAPTEWQFYIQDNGIGMDPKFFEKIFIIFQRLHDRKEYEGTGIGLAICKKIVELHGGKIWVESVKGQGSKFYFTISKLTTDKNDSQINNKTLKKHEK
ncbi:MAG: cph1 4 [Chitinophagaceae bacterium]|nr:cph1 4 [Chitinophagaceae bacterium]